MDKLDSAFDFYFAKPSNTLLPTQANFSPEPGNNIQRTCKVGLYEPTQLGLFDMHGNVWELCADELPPNRDDPKGVSLRLGRSGSWMNTSELRKANSRYPYPPSVRGLTLGLRLARVPVGPAVVVAAMNANSDRALAEWVLSLPGRPSVGLEGNKIPVSRVEDLPEGEFHVAYFEAQDIPTDKFTDADLPRIGKVSHLNSFGISCADAGGFIHI